MGEESNSAKVLPEDVVNAFRAIVDEEHRFSLWPSAREIPSGWIPAGFEGTQTECLDHISRAWTDMRPHRLKGWMDKQPPESSHPAHFRTSDKGGIQDDFEMQVERAPDAIAIVFGDHRLTYVELNRRANRLAHYLLKAGVGPEIIVGLCLERSEDLVVAILAILKAGGAYLPLDPAYPRERLRLLLDDSRATLLLTRHQLLETFRGSTIQTICLDSAESSLSQEVDTNPEPAISQQNLAYVIYTSGSTGKPKGVMIEHGALRQFVKIVRTELGCDSEDVYLQTASITYALSVRQIFVPLCSGATLVIADSDHVQDPQRLFSLIRQEHVTRMDFVPATWHSCIQALLELDADKRSRLLDNSLGHIVCVGEPLPFDLPLRWASEIDSRTQVVNIFGQTETTGMVAAYPLPRTMGGLGAIVPIGREVPFTRLTILDEDLHHVPDGTAGELCISSPCLARGYLNDPILTARKFIANPDAPFPGARLYRTGDLARRMPDGTLQHLGRLDYQVKVRGMRVESGEVESALRGHPEIRDAVVLAQEVTQGDHRLVAFLVPYRDSIPSKVDLGAFLRRQLPASMIPAFFVPLDALPLLPNGKVDRRALPLPPTPAPGALAPVRKEDDISKYLYIPTWEAADDPFPGSGIDIDGHSWLIFIDDVGLGNRVANALRQSDADVVCVRAGPGFDRIDASTFSVRPAHAPSFLALAEALRRDGFLPDRVVFCWGITDESSLKLTPADVLLERGFRSLLTLAGLMSDFARTHQVKLWIGANHTQRVTGDEQISPEKSLLAGACRALQLEMPGLVCRFLDVSPDEPTSDEGVDLAKQLVWEFSADLPGAVVAIRSGRRWMRTFVPVSSEPGGDAEITLRPRGVYLITGGLGGVGLALADFLAKRVQARLILLGRRSVPERALWDDWLTHHASAEITSRGIHRIRSLEAEGAEVLYVRADVRDRGQLNEAIASARIRFGEIHGVIHAAGITKKFGETIDTTVTESAAVLGPKVEGTALLESFFDGLPLDFLILCSSLSAILGRYGQLDYCAANAFLDAFAIDRSSKGRNVIAINWDTWKQVGLPGEAQLPAAVRRLVNRDLENGLETEMAVRAFGRILEIGAPQVVVTKRNLQARMDENNRFRSYVTPALDPPSRVGVPLLPSDRWRGDSLEVALMALWRESLGIEDIGREDNFFDLGGHSLLATGFLSAVRGRLGIDLSMSTFLETPTVSGLVQALARTQEKEVRDAAQDLGRIAHELIILNAEGSLTPFVCLPPLVDIARALGPETPFLGLRLDAAGGDWRTMSIESAARQLAEVIRERIPSGPMLVGGFCGHTELTFELACQLSKAGRKVFLALFEPTKADPHMPNPSKWTVRLGKLRQMRPSQKVHYVVAGIAQTIRSLVGLPDKSIKKNSPTRPLSAMAILARKQRMEAWRLARSNYQAGIFPGRILLIWSRTQLQETPHDGISGWDRHAAQGVSVFQVNGSHETMIREPYAAAVADILNREILS